MICTDYSSWGSCSTGTTFIEITWRSEASGLLTRHDPLQWVNTYKTRLTNESIPWQPETILPSPPVQRHPLPFSYRVVLFYFFRGLFHITFFPLPRVSASLPAHLSTLHSYTLATGPFIEKHYAGITTSVKTRRDCSLLTLRAESGPGRARVLVPLPGRALLITPRPDRKDRTIKRQNQGEGWVGWWKKREQIPAWHHSSEVQRHETEGRRLAWPRWSACRARQAVTWLVCPKAGSPAWQSRKQTAKGAENTRRSTWGRSQLPSETGAPGTAKSPGHEHEHLSLPGHADC